MKKSLFILAIILLGVLIPTTVHTESISWNIIPNLDCVAEAVYFEARGEPMEGWAAVSEVIHNRAMATNTSYCDVIRKSSVVTTKDKTITVYQFSYQMYPKTIKNRALYNQIYVYVGDHLRKINNKKYRILDQNVKHYDIKNRTPYWTKNMKVHKTIGNHTFYLEETKNG